MNKKLALLCAAVVGWWTLNGLAVGTQWMLMQDSSGQAVSAWRAMPASMIGAWGWVPLTLGLFWLARRHPIEPGRLGRGLLVHGGAVGLIIVLRAVYIYSLDRWLHWYDAPPAFMDVLVQAVWNTFFQSWLMVGVAHALFYSGRARARERQAVQLQAQLADARLAALSSQLNPHFLFNALNSIAELVHRDAEAADAMIVGLSDLLRSSLGMANSQEVALEEELRLLGHYLAIEKIRLGERLRVDWSVAPESRTAQVPPLLLQPLVENAVRHGISRRLTPGRIAVRSRCAREQLILEVQDDGGGMSEGGSGFGLGLTTTRARLQALYGAAASLELIAETGGGTIARLTLPLRRLQRAA